MSDLTNTDNQPEAKSPTVGTSSPLADNKKTPKRVRRSFIERAQEESEELVRTMGGSLELEGGRRTRSSTRGTPTRAPPVPVTPPPTKKARSSPTTPKSARSRARKVIESAIEDAPPVQKDVAPEKVEKQTVPEKKLVDKLDSVAEANNDKATKAKDDACKSENPVDNVTDTEKKDAAHSEDKTDAIGDLKPVKEVEENNIDHDKAEDDEEVKETKIEQAKEEQPADKETPMETDEAISQQPETTDSKSVATTPAADTSVSDVAAESQTKIVEPIEVPKKEATPAAAVVTKEPTPEPMEVDSSANSNQTDEPAISVESEVPHVNEVEATDKPTPISKESEEVKESSNTESEITSNPAESATAPPPSQSAEAEVADATAKPEEAETVVDGVEPTVDPVVQPEEKDVAVDIAKKNEVTAEVISNNVGNDVKSTPVVDKDASVEPLSAKPALVSSENNKSENSETCEPKLANSASDGNVSTPQVAN